MCAQVGVRECVRVCGGWLWRGGGQVGLPMGVAVTLRGGLKVLAKYVAATLSHSSRALSRPAPAPRMSWMSELRVSKHALRQCACVLR